MTTVVIDCKTGTIGADGQATSSFSNRSGDALKQTTHYYDDRVKVYKNNGIVFVAAGDADIINVQKNYFFRFGYLDHTVKGDYTIALIRRKGTHLHVDLHKSDESKTWWGGKKYKVSLQTTISDSAIITFGSGSNYAFAGMKMGMSVKEAIELAAKCDPYTNCNITIEEI